MSESLKAEASNYVRPGNDLQTQAVQSFNTGDRAAALVAPSSTFSYGMLATLCNVCAELYRYKRHHT
jgi:hypothetical protein